jgi:phosphoserine phosphatase
MSEGPQDGAEQDAKMPTHMTHTNEYAPGLVLQGFTPPLTLKAFGLIAFDMDSTLINIECVDEIAAAA